jgi:hypothetical protein
MNDEEICQVLMRVCPNPNLYFQVSQQPPYLYIFINRSHEAILQYESLTDLLGENLAELDLEEITYVAFYSRILGEMEHDWSTCVALSDFNRETVVVSSTEIEAEKSRILQEILGHQISNHSLEEVTEFVEHRANQPFADDEPTLIRELDLNSPSDRLISQCLTSEYSPPSASPASESDASYLNSDDLTRYCFVASPSLNLWEEETPIISLHLARLLAMFHRFPTRGKHRVLPLLGQIVKGDRGVVFIHFPEQVRQWFEYLLLLDSEEMDNAALWFSRYCQDSRRTLQWAKTSIKELEDASPTQESLSGQSSVYTPPPSLKVNEVNALPPLVPLEPVPHAAHTSPHPTPSTSEHPSVPITPPNWTVFFLLGIGSFVLGIIAAGLYSKQGLGALWIALGIGLLLETLRVGRANPPIWYLEGGVLAILLMVEKILNGSLNKHPLVAGYIGGWLMGMGIGYILEQQWRYLQHKQSRLGGRAPHPGEVKLLQLLAHPASVLSFGIALFAFILPLLFHA